MKKAPEQSLSAKYAELLKELEVEAALNRVRTVAMDMNNPDDLLRICETMFHELKKLGFVDLRNAMIDIHYEAGEYLLNYDYSESTGKTITTFKYKSHPIVDNLIYHAKQSSDTFTEMVYSGKALDEWRLFRKENGEADDPRIENIDALYYYFYAIGTGAIGISAFSASKPEQLNVLKHFRNVFDLAYKRYTDITNAQAQAREAQIEASLERVRGRTMAMQKSEELPETSSLLFQQLKELGETAIQNSIAIVNEEAGFVELSTTVNGSHLLHTLNVPIDDPYLMAKATAAWKAKRKSLTLEFKGQELKDYNELRNSFLETKVNFPEDQWIVNISFFSKGWLSFSSDKNVSGEIIAVQKRFAAVFDQTYTRFLDLQKAEAQAREGQIQLALERVRARGMAMQKSSELHDAAELLFRQVNDMGIKTWTTGFNVWSEDNNSYIDYIASPKGGFVEPYTVNTTQAKVFMEVSDARKGGEEFFVQYIEGERLKEIYVALSTFGDKKQFEKMLGDGFQFPSRQYNHFVFGSKVSLMFITYDPVPEAHDIFIRFGNVFEQTYTRFLDLKKAEVQAKEAQIEAALERVRSKTLAMHKSADVGDAMATMFDQLIKLGIDPSTRCGVGIIDDTKHMEVWTAYAGAYDKVDLVKGYIDMTIHPMLNGVFYNWKNKELHSSYVLIGEDQKDYYRAINHSDYHAHFKIGDLPPTQYQNAFYFPEGFIYVFSHEQLTADNVAIFKRFAGVFGLTYKRFLDLQRAEGQAREAKIEAGLERVRSSTMAMQTSDELNNSAVVVFKQLINLGIEPESLFIGIIKDDSGDIELWAPDEDGSGMGSRFAGSINGNASVKKMYEGWKEQKRCITIDMQGKELKDYFNYLKNEFQLPFKSGTTQKRRVQLITYFSQGFIGMASPDLQPQETYNLLERFTGVFNLTYTRFNDLQKAEMQALEAVKQASLDRVRGEIASMRTSNDLKRIPPLVWNELIALGVPFIRCGVFIVDEASEIIHYYLATPDGKALAAFQLPFTAEGVGRNVLHSWKNDEFFAIHWNEQEFAAYTKSLVEQGAMAAREKYITAQPLSSLDLHFFPFAQGTLYVGNIAPLNEDQRKLVQSLALAFSTAYARYEDFNRLEVAKQQVENTLAELKSAQTKLVQSEKMASLGELTAGIAHEIQNPLNFVNNFSEVNREMIDELEEELLAGNIEEALAIAADIKQNEQKITHHGKRADAIVKGMLEHSRAGTGERLLTDINVLADEFLKLSYHGLRAKDKSFNAEMIMNFDSNLPKIQLVQQDVGRLLINLFNNAFYAVNQKKKTAGPDYKPTIEVTSFFLPPQGVGGLKVRDNGTGIPDQIKDKIMQPFFTTKPTGEGTGLGLSLSYDIVVKGHGGKIEVDSKEGEYSEFTITLPIL